MKNVRLNDSFASMVDSIKRAKNDEQPENIFLQNKSMQPNEVPSGILRINEQIKELKIAIEQNVWLIGERLHSILENHLYKDLNYTSFEAYANKECEFKGRTAFKYISIYKCFNYQEIGTLTSEKLYILSRVEDQDMRKQLQVRVEQENLSTRQLEKEVKQIGTVNTIPPSTTSKARSGRDSTRMFELFEKRYSNRISLQIELPLNLQDSQLNRMKDRIMEILSESRESFY